MSKIILTEDFVEQIEKYSDLVYSYHSWDTVIPGCDCGCGGDIYPEIEKFEEMEKNIDTYKSLFKDQYNIYCEEYGDEIDYNTIIREDNTISFGALESIVDYLIWNISTWNDDREEYIKIGSKDLIEDSIKRLREAGIIGVKEISYIKYEKNTNNKNELKQLLENIFKD